MLYDYPLVVDNIGSACVSRMTAIVICRVEKMAATIALFIGVGGTDGVNVIRRRRLRQANRVVVLNWIIGNHGELMLSNGCCTSKGTKVYKGNDRY